MIKRLLKAGVERNAAHWTVPNIILICFHAQVLVLRLRINQCVFMPGHAGTEVGRVA
jgi:hypothetical protein